MMEAYYVIIGKFQKLTLGLEMGWEGNWGERWNGSGHDILAARSTWVRKYEYRTRLSTYSQYVFEILPLREVIYHWYPFPA